ncbi:phosphotransferase family protein [Asanoa ferruginea]|uniref:phosphotransferase family protein n=1 Tax=Asanoa ferruginea TaxID=53367 RepID=UPI001EF361A7|nr:phosphotransferase [Asanoa ferruginea]
MRALHAGDGPWLLRVESARRSVEVVLRAPTPRIDGDMIATNVAALLVAERHSLPAPRLLGADVDGRTTGVPASVETLVEGSSAWPARASVDHLRAAGAAIARVHRIAIAPSAHLPLRERPIAVDDFAKERRLGKMPTTRLLDRADAVIRDVRVTAGAPILVHGDVWPGNLVGQTLIDWKTADGAYWDAVAALNTPTECDPPEHTARRDEFLRAALARL